MKETAHQFENQELRIKNLVKSFIRESRFKIHASVKPTGFTLIELLVVISIIGLLATLLMANLNTSRARARDAQRKSDLRNIQTALRLYYNDHSGYPGGSAGLIVGCDSGSGLEACAWGGSFAVTGNDPYMAILPGDPLPDQQYVYTDDAVNDSYALSVCLENKSDTKCGGSCSVDHDPTGTEAPDGCLYEVKP